MLRRAFLQIKCKLAAQHAVLFAASTGLATHLSFPLSPTNGFTHSIENKWDQIVEGRNFDLKNLSKSKLALLDPSEMYVSPIDFKKIFR